LHESIRDLGRPRGIDDFLDETLALAEAAAGGSRARRCATAEELDAFARAAGAVGVVDGTVGPRIVLPREPVIRRLSNRAIATAVEIDDHVPTVDEIIAREDARFGGVEGDPDWVAGSTYAGMEECAAGKKRVHGRSGGDKGPRVRRTGGTANPPLSGPTKVAHEHWDEDQRGGKVRPVVVGARVTIESKDALDADKTASNGEVMESVAIVMRKTGRSKQQVLEALNRLAETGMVDPDLADALPAAPLTPDAAA
jgi:hypothetical protein